ncbi:Lrp/AsnC family transcriptional regulator [Diaphorobacter sp. HDW4A]|uniref:siroheme decarboxylase subunit beta n=1 Tax=Diaphorobacter sp. HDW4A TaxID=2714924 RepID=UPI00140D5D45|nr:Lrp/AsnC family transcriptional regulator [Diaphorobacter sp. HDW4A]QIL79830.1 Lrp/AsnC family transcriptional regulator [Diaphorobacter sp. HDW4A]
MPQADRTALALLNQWQRDFPLVDEPFATIGETLGLRGRQVLDRYQRLQNLGAFSRIGGVFAPGAGGASLLAAMAVPPQMLERVAAIVSAQPGVNHNYEREHEINLWFVVTGRDAWEVEQQLQHIEAACGLRTLRLPMLRAFRIDTAFDLSITSHDQQTSGRTRIAAEPIGMDEEPLAALVEQGLTLCERPFDAWTQHLGCGLDDIRAQLARWTDNGSLSRFGVVVRHHEVGFRANAMVVFQVPAHRIDACGDALAHFPGATLVYQRATAEGWPFNLYCMVHGRDRLNVQQTIAAAIRHAVLDSVPSRTLFSRTRFKQTGARRFASHLQVPHLSTTTPTEISKEKEHAHS